MKKLNSLTNPILDLDGLPTMKQLGTNPDGSPILVVETIGRTLANVLARGRSADPVKAMMIAMQIYGAKSVELEDTDFALVKDVFDKDPLLSNLGSAALMAVLNGAVEKAAKA